MPRSLGFNLSSDSTSKVGMKALRSHQVTAASSNTNDTIWTNFFWGWLSIWAKEGFKVQSSHYLRKRERDADHVSSAVCARNVYMWRELFLYICWFQHPLACLKLNTQSSAKCCTRTFSAQAKEEHAWEDKILFLNFCSYFLAALILKFCWLWCILCLNCFILY